MRDFTWDKAFNERRKEVEETSVSTFHNKNVDSVRETLEECAINRGWTKPAHSWIFHQDYASSHIALATREFLAKKKYSNLANPAYSPDLSPCEVFLFSRPKKVMNGSHFMTVKAFQDATTKYLLNISEKHFVVAYDQWKKCWERCVASERTYFEDI